MIRLRLFSLFACALTILLLTPAIALATEGITLSVSADPSELSAAGDVTYTYTVTNSTASDAPTASAIASVTVTDDKLGSITLTGGDDNGDGKLDASEYWVYQATATIAETTDSSAIAAGIRTEDEVSVADTQTVTVTVADSGTTTDTATTTTEDGGTLPATASPWMNILVAGLVLAAAGGLGVWYGLRRADA